MKATIVHVRNPLQPALDREIRTISRELTINQVIAQEALRFDLPTICVKNGEIILRADNRWDTEVVRDGDVVGFMTVLQGGKGSNPFMILAMVVLTVATWGVGSAMASAGYNTLAIGLAKTAIMVGGAAIVNAVIGPPKAPSSINQKQQAAPSPVYSLSAQGNQARLGQPIPDIYGEHRIYPDFAADPYTEYAGNEQYLYQLFCIGQGEYEIDPGQIRIEDTPISNFPEITYQFYGPNQPVTLFPTNVETVGEVSGQELLTNQYVPATEGFLANSAGTQITQISFDLICPKGLFKANNTGGFSAMSVAVIFEIALADDNGNRTGVWQPIGAANISGTTNTPIRKTYTFNLPQTGRYMVRVVRTDVKDTSSLAGHDVLWAGARGFIEGSRNYGNVTMFAVKMRATNSLSETSSRRVNMKVIRKLKVYDPNTGTWSATNMATRSIASALRNICEANYGAKLSTSRFSLEDLEYLSVELGQRGDFFDAVFDAKINVWEALSVTARCGRAMPIRQGGLIRFIRDRQQSIPTAMFTMRNIVKDSFKIEYIMPGEDTADAVEIEYFDRDLLKPKTYVAALPGSLKEKIAKRKLFGCTNEDHAGREGLSIAAANRYRRRIISFRTELEGHLPIFGDLIAVSHEMPSWGISGELVNFDGQTFTLSEPVEFKPATDHYIALRKRDGSVVGMWKVVAHVLGDPYKVTLDPIVTLGFTPYTGRDEERTYFSFGPAGLVYMQAIVTRIVPRGHEIEIEAVNENVSVHTAENGFVASTPVNWQLPKRNTKPVLGSLSVSHGGTSSSPILLLSWPPAVNADHYVIETSRDNANWTRWGQVTTTSATVSVEPGHVWLRVAPVGLTQGNWVLWDGDAGQIPPPGNVTGLVAEENFVGTRARIKWNVAPRAEYYTVEVWAAGVLRRTTSVTIPRYEYSAEDVTKDGGPWRSLTFKVWANSALGQSESSADITLSNPAPGALTGVSVYAGVKSVMITYTRPTDLDFSEVIVCMSTTQGFTPDPETNLAYRGSDRTITIPNLAEDTTYYFRLAAADTFGIDGLDFGANEYQATITSLNLPTPTEVKDALQEALSDPAATPLVFEADTFAVNMAGTDRFPFIIGQVEGQDVIQLDANVYVLGTLSASQIRSGDIAVDQQIRLGNGNMILDGAGAMIVYNPNSPDLDHPDYAFFNAGRLTFQVYRDGAYQEQKAVKRVEFGVANSGETVFIPGYWDSQPKLMIGPKNLMSFREDFVAQNQSWLIEPRNFRETSPNSQRWQFDAIAELNLSENSGTITAGSAQGWGATNTFTSLAYNLIGNTSQITVNFVAGSYRGTGTNTNVWAYRAVRWKIQLYNNALGQWQDVNSFRVVSITAQGAAQVVKTDSATVAVSSAHTQVRIYAEAYDSGGAYTTGGDTFTYWQGDVGGNAAVADCIHGPTTAYCTLATPNVPAGYSIYQVDYYYQWRYEIGFGTQEAIEFAQQFRFYGAGRGWGPQSFVHDAYDQGLGRVGNWQQVNLIAATSYFDANLMYVQAYNPSQLTFQPYGLIRTQGVWARVYAKRLNINSSTPVNYFQFQSFAWVTPSAATIANGSLNWFAVGE